jgi:hypothetical protein
MDDETNNQSQIILYIYIYIYISVSRGEEVKNAEISIPVRNQPVVCHSPISQDPVNVHSIIVESLDTLRGQEN